MAYRLLADLIVTIHSAYVAFVVVGQVLILVGWWRGWRWVRNFWFRVMHLIAIGIVALEAIFDVACPLTTWEQRLREMAGDQVSRGTFIGDLLDKLIFIDAPPWAFTVAYVAFALLVAATFYFAPPRRRARRGSTAAPASGSLQ
ncbi:MAG TPA: DUF2784 domain-containing protein [Gemmataceae bacterium]|jgi:hypothetical protein|nr:DUF2784 domain-containing protein [Gemmataceae bacterium]